MDAAGARYWSVGYSQLMWQAHLEVALVKGLSSNRLKDSTELISAWSRALPSHRKVAFDNLSICSLVVLVYSVHDDGSALSIVSTYFRRSLDPTARRPRITNPGNDEEPIQCDLRVADFARMILSRLWEPSICRCLWVPLPFPHSDVLSTHIALSNKALSNDWHGSGLHRCVPLFRPAHVQVPQNARER